MAVVTRTERSTAKYGTVVANCSTCRDHAYQDKTYGPKRRLHNLCHKGTHRRCTVCGKDTGV